MAYYNIEKRLKSDGTPRYRCNVIIKEKGVITYRESKTFPKHAHAKTWGTQKVMELDLYGIPSSNAVDGLTVRDLLHKYLNDPNAGGKAGIFCVVLYANRRSMPVTMGRSRPRTKIYTSKR